MPLFLRLKHWQLFLLFVGLPFITPLALTGLLLTAHNPVVFMSGLIALMLLFLTGIMAWYYTLGCNLYRKQPPGSDLHLNRFRLAVFVPAAYMTLICTGILVLMGNHDAPRFNPVILLLVIPLHLCSLLCMCYILYFIAKALKSAELERPALFSDYVGEFFLMWFYPVGVWIIQPRINRLFAGSSGGNELEEGIGLR